MDLVKPPAKDFVPRRQVEIAASKLQAYASSPHKDTTPKSCVLFPAMG